MRHAGLLIPLFSLRTSRDWGIGEISDLVPLGRWMAASSLDRLMLLPLGTLLPGETSPYSSISTMSIDPSYISLDDVEDFGAVGGARSLSESARSSLNRARPSAVTRYDDVRAAKGEALRRAFERFWDHEWQRDTARAGQLRVFADREAWWLDDFALFQAIRETRPGVSWREWPAPLRDRHPSALDEARAELARAVVRETYWQWLAHEQWTHARTALANDGVQLFGDMPFGVGLDSAEVWARAEEFLLDVSVGVPPDAFSDSGQDWGLPGYNWEAIRRSDFAWLRARLRRAAALFDGMRIDHLVGLYRTYAKRRDGSAFFSPDGEEAQTRQGEDILRLAQATGLEIHAEDLGTVPDFVRASLARLGVAGTKVLRWERDWKHPRQPFLDPATYPPISLAISGSHDNEPLAVWWDEMPLDDRAALLALPMMRDRARDDATQPWSDQLRDALLAQLFAAGSNDVVVPIQDVFGWRDRVNTPGTVSESNWTWRLPWAIDDPAAEAERATRSQALRELTAVTRRGPAR